MTFAHDSIAALPTLSAADKALLRSLVTSRMAYCFAADENVSDFVALDPDTGSLPVFLIQNGLLFELDAADSTATPDGVTCLATSDGKRYKTGDLTYPWSVLDKDTSAEPDEPSVGDRYLIPVAATGTTWAGKDNQVGIYTARGWQFAVVPIGRFLYVEDETAFYHRAASGSWTAGVGSLTLGDNAVRPASVIGRPFTWIVENQTTNAPPGTASVGVQYIIGPSPTGSWAGNAGKIALCEATNTFTIYTPRTGETAYDKALVKNVQYSGTGWLTSSDALVLIQTQVAAGVATIDFTTGLDDTYDAYELRISSAKPATDDVQAWLRVGTGAGPTWQSGSSTYAWGNSTNIVGSALNAGSGTDTKIALTYTTSGSMVGSAAGENFSGSLFFDNPEATDFCNFTFSGRYNRSTDSASMPTFGGGSYKTAGAITGLRFLFSSGNIAAGRFSLYGLRKS